MPKIKPFRGIHPVRQIADQVIVNLENLSISDAKVIQQENPYSYVNMVVPKLDNLFLLGSKNELAYKKINENFEEFLEKGILVRDPKSSFYIYKYINSGIVQTGIWVTTSIDDYLSNVVKKHELTKRDREESLIEYLQQTGIDANPVLITYQAIPGIDQIIAQSTRSNPELEFSKNGSGYSLWKIDEDHIILELTGLFANLASSYIADGHHRAAAASLLGIQRRKLNLKHQGNEEYNYFSSVYMSTDQLRIYSFNRIVKGLNGLSEEELINEISACFVINEAESHFIPEQIHQFGMYLRGKWYSLIAREIIIQDDNPLTALDVSLLHDHVLSPLLNINDPRTDPRISYSSGSTPLFNLVAQVDSGKYDIAFILYPTSIDQLMKVADEGEVMPPKSTCFEPKFEVGLLIHEIN
jgi:uncharacterized protein (DUF1015 family)